MPKFRKKPVTIDAFQFTGSFEEVDKWLQSLGYDAADVADDGPAMSQNTDGTLAIDTLEGQMRCDLQDFIIRGVNGEFYPCKPEIFAKTYDKVYEPSAAGVADRIADSDNHPIDWDKRDAAYGR